MNYHFQGLTWFLRDKAQTAWGIRHGNPFGYPGRTLSPCHAATKGTPLHCSSVRVSHVCVHFRTPQGIFFVQVFISLRLRLRSQGLLVDVDDGTAPKQGVTRPRWVLQLRLRRPAGSIVYRVHFRTQECHFLFRIRAPKRASQNFPASVCATGERTPPALYCGGQISHFHEI